jgi:hypothetical protein
MVHGLGMAVCHCACFAAAVWRCVALRKDMLKQKHYEGVNQGSNTVLTQEGLAIILVSFM